MQQLNSNPTPMNTILNQGVFTAAVEKELIRARAIKTFITERIQKLLNMTIDPVMKGESAAKYEAKFKEIASCNLDEKTKASITQKIVQLKKMEEAHEYRQEEAYRKGYIDALSHVLKFVEVLPPVQ